LDVRLGTSAALPRGKLVAVNSAVVFNGKFNNVDDCETGLNPIPLPFSANPFLVKTPLASALDAIGCPMDDESLGTWLWVVSFSI
jgi:hypothetical protein